MTSTRSSEDQCAINQKSGINAGIMGYIMDTTQNAPSVKCIPELGIFTHVTRTMPVSHMVDAESKLFGIDRKLSKCNNYGLPCAVPNKQGLYCDNKPEQYVLNSCEFIKYPARPTNLGYKL